MSPWDTPWQQCSFPTPNSCWFCYSLFRHQHFIPHGANTETWLNTLTSAGLSSLLEHVHKSTQDVRLSLLKRSTKLFVLAVITPAETAHSSFCVLVWYFGRQTDLQSTKHRKKHQSRSQLHLATPHEELKHVFKYTVGANIWQRHKWLNNFTGFQQKKKKQMLFFFHVKSMWYVEKK